MKFEEVSYEEGIHKNRAEYCSAKKPRERDTFFENMNNMSFEQLEKEYGLPVKIPFNIKIKMKIAKFIRNMFRMGVM